MSDPEVFCERGLYWDIEDQSFVSSLAEEIATAPMAGKLGVQGRGGESSEKEIHEPDDWQTQCLALGDGLEMLRARLPEGQGWRLLFWLNRTPETAAIAAHAHNGEWAGLIYAGVPQDAAPLVFVREDGSEFARVDAKAGRAILWPSEWIHRVEARPSSHPGVRLALVCNAFRA